MVNKNYSVGDCLVGKTGVIQIVGKFSKKVYEVVKYGRNFLSYDIRGYSTYQLNKYFKKCEPEVIYKADKLLKINWNIVNNTVKNSKATRKAKCSVVMDPRGYILQIRIENGWWKQISINYGHNAGCHTYCWEHWGSTPIYIKEYKLLNTYLSTLKESLSELWQNIRILSE